jgi:hypothetical protein
MIHRKNEIIFSGLTAFAFAGCGSSELRDHQPVLIASAMVSLADHEASFPLTYSSLRIKVDNCASGYTADSILIDHLQLYRGDRGCRLSLMSFSNGLEDFSGGPLQGPVGTIAEFKSKTSTISVEVISTINDPIDEHDQILYHVSSVLGGQSHPNTLALDLGISGRYKTGLLSSRVPLFKIKQFAIKGLDPVTKSFLANLELECQRILTNVHNLDSTRCYRLRLKDISYKLVPDTFLNRPTFHALEEIFKKDAVKVNPSRDILKPNKDFRGGFRTTTQNDILKTPINTAKKPDMLFILKSPWGYQYFNLDLTTHWQSR